MPFDVALGSRTFRQAQDGAPTGREPQDDAQANLRTSLSNYYSLIVENVKIAASLAVSSGTQALHGLLHRWTHSNQLRSDAIAHSFSLQDKAPRISSVVQDSILSGPEATVTGSKTPKRGIRRQNITDSR